MKGCKINCYKHLQSNYYMLHVVQSTANSCYLVNNLLTAMNEYVVQLQVNKIAESFSSWFMKTLFKNKNDGHVCIN